MANLSTQERPRGIHDLPLFCSLLAVAMLVSAHVLYSDHTTKTTFDMTFCFGPAIRGLIEQHRLGYPDGVFGWWTYARRMPMIPVFGALVSSISTRFAVFFAIKNLLCWSVWIYALLRLRRRHHIGDYWILLAAALVILVPFNGSIASHAEFEEGYLVAMLGLAFVLLLSAAETLDYACIGLLVALIYLTKSSMPLVCGVIVSWAAVDGWKRCRFRALLPALGLALAALGWGTYVYANTGVFAFGADESSWNGWNFLKGNNPNAVVLYPRIPLDSQDDAVNGPYPKGGGLYPLTPMHNEWELSHAQFATGRQFVHDHPNMVLQMDRKKVWVACCDVLEAPERIPGQTRPLVIVSNIIDHTLVAVCLLWMVLRAWKRRFSAAEALFLLLIPAYLASYLFGGVYIRHMVPIYSLASMVLAIQLAGSIAGTSNQEAELTPE